MSIVDGGGFGGAFAFLFAVVAALVLIAAWVILAGSRFVQGGVVEHPERVPQLYGYTACLIGLVMAVMAVMSIADAALRLRAPEYAGSDWGGFEPSVSSFEAFRVTYDQAREMRSAPNDRVPEVIPEDELRRRYEGMRADRIARTRVQARHSLITSVLSLVLGLALFVGHWRWLQRYRPRTDPSRPQNPVMGA